MKSLNRRAFLKRSVSLSALLMNSLASGLPVGYLLNPKQALAQENSSQYQTLILSTSSRGDPLNINCPGAYVDGVTNNPILESSRASFGGTRHRGAKVWGDLSADLRERLAFFHYSPRTAAHPEYSSTMTMRGSVKNDQGNGSEMFASAISQMSYAPMTYLQEEPIPLCNSVLSFKSQPLQRINPVDIKALFSPTDQLLADLRQRRDAVLDQMYQDLSGQGNSAQRNFIDRYAQSRQQARNFGEQLGDLLDRLPTNEDEPNSPLDQVIAAVALARLKITPVITINIPFGRDNHQDNGLVVEAEETTSGTTLIQTLWNELKTAQIEDQVSFATMNVFGRRAHTNSRGGRDHNQHHAVMVAFGAHVQGGVYGGIDADGKALSIDGIPLEQTMEAAGASLAKALGHSEQMINHRISNGQIVNQFIRS